MRLLIKQTNLTGETAWSVVHYITGVALVASITDAGKLLKLMHRLHHDSLSSYGRSFGTAFVLVSFNKHYKTGALHVASISR